MKKAAIFLIISFMISSIAFAQPAWVGQEMKALGYSKIPSSGPALSPRQKLTARRGASFDARRNLLNQIVMLKVDSNTTIGDLVSNEDKTDINTSSLLRSVYLEKSDYSDDGTCTVEAVVNLSDVYSFLKEEKLLEK